MSQGDPDRERRYRVEFTPHALKQFRKLPTKVRERIERRVELLSENPRPRDVKKLTDEDQLYRIRVGQYRVIYSIEDDLLLVTLVKMGDRKDVFDP